MVTNCDLILYGEKIRIVCLSEQIDGMIRTIRVVLDRDLAEIHGVPTFRFNEAIKRKRHRLPTDFMFQLTREEFDSLKSQIAMSKAGRGRRHTVPYAFTEHGALQAATVLRSKRAVQMSQFVIRAFVKMRACDALEIASGLACATLKWDVASDFQISLPPT